MRPTGCPVGRSGGLQTRSPLQATERPHGCGGTQNGAATHRGSLVPWSGRQKSHTPPDRGHKVTRKCPGRGLPDPCRLARARDHRPRAAPASAPAQTESPGGRAGPGGWTALAGGESIQASKGFVCLDEHQVRYWRSWYRVGDSGHPCRRVPGRDRGHRTRPASPPPGVIGRSAITPVSAPAWWSRIPVPDPAVPHAVGWRRCSRGGPGGNG